MRTTNVKIKGYAILELLFYISFFAVLALAVIAALMSMSRTFKETAINAEIIRGGSIMDRMAAEIRQAYDINVVGVTNLKLNTTNDAGGNATVEFSLSGTNVELRENDALVGNLNSPDIIVTALNFTSIITSSGKTIKTFMSLSSADDPSGRTFDFYDTITLRGSY